MQENKVEKPFSACGFGISYESSLFPQLSLLGDELGELITT
jgi:hypothetical protein